MAMKYKTVGQRQSIRKELFWSKNKIYRGLCPTTWTNPDHVVIHVGTKDLASKKESVEVSSSIMDLALTLKSDTRQISVSNLTTRNAQYHKKALEVNQHLNVLRRLKKINIIDHGNTITVRHLHGSKLHLNLKGNKVLTEKSTEAISNIFHRQSL